MNGSSSSEVPASRRSSDFGSCIFAAFAEQQEAIAEGDRRNLFLLAHSRPRRAKGAPRSRCAKSHLSLDGPAMPAACCWSARWIATVSSSSLRRTRGPRR